MKYMLKDHLGNTRAVVKQDGSIVDISDYYAFGLEIGDPITPSPDNKYKYNGKEWNTELSLNSYDYGARFYDPVKARWDVVDPFVEKHYDINPYNYVLNNPLVYIDPFGLDTLNANTITPEQWKKFRPNEDVMTLAEVTVTANKQDNSNTLAYTDFFMGGLEYKLGQSVKQFDRLDGVRSYEPYRFRDLARKNPAIKTRPVNIDLEVPLVNKSLGRFVVPRNVVRGIGTGLKIAGIGTALYGTVSSTLDYNAGRISGAHLTTNLVMTGLGFAWPVGTIVSAGYSLVAEDLIFSDEAANRDK